MKYVDNEVKSKKERKKERNAGKGKYLMKYVHKEGKT